MNTTVPTYEVRLKKIKTVSDIDKQIELAKQYAQRIRSTQRKKACSLDEKLRLLATVKEADEVTRQLKLNRHVIENKLGLKSELRELDGVRFIF